MPPKTSEGTSDEDEDDEFRLVLRIPREKED